MTEFALGCAGKLPQPRTPNPASVRIRFLLLCVSALVLQKRMAAAKKKRQQQPEAACAEEACLAALKEVPSECRRAACWAGSERQPLPTPLALIIEYCCIPFLPPPGFPLQLLHPPSPRCFLINIVNVTLPASAIILFLATPSILNYS